MFGKKCIGCNIRVGGFFGTQNYGTFTSPLCWGCSNEKKKRQQNAAEMDRKTTSAVTYTLRDTNDKLKSAEEEEANKHQESIQTFNAKIIAKPNNNDTRSTKNNLQLIIISVILICIDAFLYSTILNNSLRLLFGLISTFLIYLLIYGFGELTKNKLKVPSSWGAIIWGAYVLISCGLMCKYFYGICSLLAGLFAVVGAITIISGMNELHGITAFTDSINPESSAKSKKICCICGKNINGLDHMRDNVTGKICCSECGSKVGVRFWEHAKYQRMEC